MADDQTITGSTTRPTRVRRLCALGALSFLVATLAGCNTSPTDRAEVQNGINQARSAAGLRVVTGNAQLDAKADSWAHHLSDICDLEHSKLSDGAPSNWQKLGENVGYGGTIADVQAAYMNSPGHRANILDPSFTQVGTAAIWSDCGGSHRVFTVQVFMKT